MYRLELFKDDVFLTRLQIAAPSIGEAITKAKANGAKFEADYGLLVDKKSAGVVWEGDPRSDPR